MRRLIIYPQQGLCNRLRALVSAQQLAELSGRRLVLGWLPTAACGCEFDELFSDPIDRVSAQSRRVLDADVMNYVMGGAGQEDGPNPTGVMSGADRIRYVDPWMGIVDVCSAVSTIEVYSHTVLRQPGEGGDRLAKIAPYFNRLRPIPWIDTQVRRMVSERFRTTMLGVHIRRGDHYHYQTQRGLGLLEQEEARFLAATERYLVRHPRAGIFVATDEETSSGLTQRLVERFGDRICWYPKRTLDRNRTDGLQDALVDLLLLNHCDFLLGTRNSSFSTMGMMRNLEVRQQLDRCGRIIEQPGRRLHRGLARLLGQVRQVAGRWG